MQCSLRSGKEKEIQKGSLSKNYKCARQIRHKEAAVLTEECFDVFFFLREDSTEKVVALFTTISNAIRLTDNMWRCQYPKIGSTTVNFG